MKDDQEVDQRDAEQRRRGLEVARTGLILFVITFIVLAAARYMLLRIERRVG